MCVCVCVCFFLLPSVKLTFTSCARVRVALPQLCPAGAWAYPVCFLTNGGGMLEADKALQLTNWLGVPVTESQVNCSCAWHDLLLSLPEACFGAALFQGLDP